MQTQNLKLPKNYRDTASNFYIRLSIGLIAVLAILNVFQLFLVIKETNNNNETLRVIHQANKNLTSLQESLGKMDMKRAFVQLADARRQIAAALPPMAGEPPEKKISTPPAQPAQPAPPAAETPVKVASAPPAQPAQPAKVPAEPVDQTAKRQVAEQKTPVIPAKSAGFAIPAGETPAPLISAVAGEYALICEKESKLLHLFKYLDDRIVLIKSYPCIIGANGEDKKKAGDYATPKGSYFTLRYTPGSALPEIYGEGAFVLNYPNFLDRKDSKAGTGIWIHGHVPGKAIGNGDLLNTKGCIAVSNEDIKELKGLIKASGTPVSIVDRVAFVKENSRKESVKEVQTFIDDWRQAWESGDTQKYLGHYAKDFINSDGMTFDAFKRHKERVNRGKKFIRVKAEQLAIIFPQEREGQIAVVRFIQRYRSNNFDVDSRKLFYLKKGQKGWAISGESAF
jgi:murein L,D-transpeptidase YafK